MAAAEKFNFTIQKPKQGAVFAVRGAIIHLQVATRPCGQYRYYLNTRSLRATALQQRPQTARSGYAARELPYARAAVVLFQRNAQPA